MRRVVVVAGLLVALAAACNGKTSPAERGLPTGMTVTSTAFAGGRPVPSVYSCEGDNLPPPLRWTGVPQGVAELAVDVTDPDAPSGTFVHWIATGIPTTTAAIGTGLLSSIASLHEFRGSSGSVGYTGPCPPDKGGVHHYIFEVLALREHVDLPDGLTPMQHVERLRAAAAAGGHLIGTFQR